MKLFQPTPSAVSAWDRRDARQQEDDTAQWRDYHTWLTGQRTLLAARSAAAHPTFERSADTQAAAAAQAASDRIPTDNRALFAAILADERQAAQQQLEASAPAGRAAHPADPDAVEERALVTLLAQAAGEVATPETPTGYGWFPRGVPGDVRWYALDVADLLAAPTAAAYALADSGTDTRQRIRSVAAATVGLLIFLGVWFGWLRPTRPQPTPALAVPVVTDTNAPNATPLPLELAPVTAAVLRRGAQGTRITLGTTSAAAWPAPTDATPGYWHQRRFGPPALCLDGPLLRELTGLVLVGGGGWPDRVYTLSDQAASADLLVEACRGGEQRSGALVQTVAPQPAALGNAVALPGQPDTAVTVAAITLVEPDDDPTLPTGQARVVVAVRAPPAVDWPALSPTLITPDGQRALPAEVVTTADGAALRYLVAQPAGALPIAWDLARAGQVLRWRATLDPADS